jgi:hypothetical protein
MRHLIFHNFWLKVFSVALATVIWLAIYHGIQNDQNPAQTIINHLAARQFIRVPVSLVKSPGDARLFKITPPAVIVSVSGEDLESHHLTASDLRAFVDVTELPAGKSVLAPIRAEGPAGDSIQDIRPSSVMVEEAPKQ